MVGILRLSAMNPKRKKTKTPGGKNAAQTTASAAEGEGGELQGLQAQLEEQRDQLLRARAECENIRKRAEAEAAGARKFALEKFARELLAVRDSLEKAAEADADAEGVALTLRQMDAVFERFSIAMVRPAAGERFDPELHEAMSMAESAEVPANHVLAVMQAGYRLHDRLLRPAMVVVARAPAAVDA